MERPMKQYKSRKRSPRSAQLFLKEDPISDQNFIITNQQQTTTTTTTTVANSTTKQNHHYH